MTKHRFRVQAIFQAVQFGFRIHLSITSGFSFCQHKHSFCNAVLTISKAKSHKIINIYCSRLNNGDGVMLFSTDNAELEQLVVKYDADGYFTVEIPDRLLKYLA